MQTEQQRILKYTPIETKSSWVGKSVEGAK